MEHRHNAYCTDTECCELVYTDDTTAEHAAEQITVSYWHRLGLKVTRVEEAPEAPGFGEAPMHTESLTPFTPSDQKRWLVWYER